MTLTVSKLRKMQKASGLLDKNGNRIFEGDIVDCDMNYNGSPLVHRGAIEYNETFGAFCTRNDAGQTLLHNHFLSTFEVIGNIYEHSHLLKQ